MFDGIDISDFNIIRGHVRIFAYLNSELFVEIDYHPRGDYSYLSGTLLYLSGTFFLAIT